MDLYFILPDGGLLIVPEAPEGYSREDGSVQIDPPPSPGHRWINEAWAIPAPLPDPVPETITMRQAKIQLSRAGLLANANAVIASLDGQQGEEARLEWEYATSLRRDHPLVMGIGQSLGLSDEMKDNLFRQAALIG